MKLAITGKGGVGKTTLTALLAQSYADMGRQVLAVDADPSPCLAGALGFPDELRDELKPIAEMDALIEERTGAKPGTVGGFFTSTHAWTISPNASACCTAACACSKWGAWILAARAVSVPSLRC